MEPKVSDFLWSKVPPKQIVNNLILPFYKLLLNQAIIYSFRENAKFDIDSKRLPDYGHLLFQFENYPIPPNKIVKRDIDWNKGYLDGFVYFSPQKQMLPKVEPPTNRRRLILDAVSYSYIGKSAMSEEQGSQEGDFEIKDYLGKIITKGDTREPFTNEIYFPIVCKKIPDRIIENEENYTSMLINEFCGFQLRFTPSSMILRYGLFILDKNDNFWELKWSSTDMNFMNWNSNPLLT
ncbi:MAG TPA: hypothetical protein DCM40_40925 [Maribacter sp.]|nr:hypothetical protein [Maribacter sp.]